MYSYEKVEEKKYDLPHWLHCNDKDFYTHYLIIQTYKPDIIHEYGAGSGMWCALLNELIDYSPQFYLIENFYSAHNEKDFYGYLPSNKEELMEELKKVSPSIQAEIYISAEDSYQMKHDFTRIDCGVYDYMKSITDASSIVTVDDIYKDEPFAKRRLESLEGTNTKDLWYGHHELIVYNENNLSENNLKKIISHCFH